MLRRAGQHRGSAESKRVKPLRVLLRVPGFMKMTQTCLMHFPPPPPLLPQHQRRHLDLARSVKDHAEEQRALATIGRTYLFRYESDQSRKSLEQAKDAFRKSLAIVDDCLDGQSPLIKSNHVLLLLFSSLEFSHFLSLQGPCLRGRSTR